jgi:hypothetical protein
MARIIVSIGHTVLKPFWRGVMFKAKNFAVAAIVAGSTLGNAHAALDRRNNATEEYSALALDRPPKISCPRLNDQRIHILIQASANAITTHSESILSPEHGGWKDIWVTMSISAQRGMETGEGSLSIGWGVDLPLDEVEPIGSKSPIGNFIRPAQIVAFRQIPSALKKCGLH